MSDVIPDVEEVQERLDKALAEVKLLRRLLKISKEQAELAEQMDQ